MVRQEKIDKGEKGKKPDSNKGSEGEGRTSKGEKFVRKLRDTTPIAGYLVKYGDEIMPGVPFEKGDKLEPPTIPGWLAQRMIYDDVGVRIMTDFSGLETPDGVVKLTEFRSETVLVERQLGLSREEIDHLLALVGKEKFGVDDTLAMRATLALRDKLRGFAETPLFDEPEPEPAAAAPKEEA